MVKKKNDTILGLIAIVAGTMIVVGALAALLLRIVAGILGVLLINFGLRMRGLPPLQILIPMMLSRKGLF